MIQVLWEYEVNDGQAVAFETYYSSLGAWALLFQKAPGYRGTVLLHDTERATRYLTVDMWSDRAAYDAFRRDHAAEYQKLDAECAAFTSTNRCIGIFEMI